MIMSAAMLLRHSLGLETEAQAVEEAVNIAITNGDRTPDLGGSHSTNSLSEKIIEGLAAGFPEN
jgi:3-isopropylmalate dehydrogenase